MHGLPRGELHLVPSAPEWPSIFAAERERIGAALGPLALRIEHIGSTAVPGLLAKPIIDAALAVGSPPDADSCIAPLQGLGYEYRGRHGEDPSRRYYVLERDGRRLFQLHLWILPTRAWERHLTFRDLLRARPDLADAYAEEKLRVAEQVGWNKGEYAVAKGPFIEELMRAHLGNVQA